METAGRMPDLRRGRYIEIGSILNMDMAALIPQDCFILGNNLLQVKIFRMLYNAIEVFM